ncbi:MAG: hypothetical protein KDD66_05680 [Bdellovibrionales bacterium]|nr:hypothetical protein [Bdellovibrionales bacterium]
MDNKLKFQTKARTLESLKPILKSASIKSLFYFNVNNWSQSSQAVLDEIAQKFGNAKLIVRSSAISEDSATQSLAGAYLSVADVDATNPRQITEAVNNVIASYPDNNPNNEVLIQELVENITMSGVLFTREIDSLAPYFVINYDTSGSSDSVTSGTSRETKTYMRFRGSPFQPSDKAFAHLIETANELMQLFGNDALDIEFALDKKGDLFLLQVRPLVRPEGKHAPTEEHLGKYLTKLYKKAEKLNTSHPGLCGKTGAYSVMTDWNPAEMIGRRPKGLARSLYKELITDYTWAYQRDNYGYRNLRSYPLMISFMGHPYIDVRVSFNSFVPKALKDELAEKLVNYYIDSLSASPSNHDKVEFNVVFSCFYLNLPQQLEILKSHGFSAEEIEAIESSLLSITNNIIDTHTGLYRFDLEKIDHLNQRFFEVSSGELSRIDEIYWLIQDCKRYGTLPFAGLARAGFIAVQMLRSIVDTGIITEQEQQLFMNSLNTVARQLASDYKQLGKGADGRKTFLDRYGHLRPGTYDILSPNYRNGFEKYFSAELTMADAPSEAKFEFSKEQLDSLDKKLAQNLLDLSAQELLQFIEEAIQGREYAKFIFTRNLNRVLELLEELGQRHDISTENMAHVEISTVLDLYSNLTHEDVRDVLLRDIEKNKTLSEVADLICLPQLIVNGCDVYDFHLSEIEPNYIGRGKVTELVVREGEFEVSDLEGKIVFIASADPGYDWIFTHSIKGLVTMYGGANSHMAIRCAELGIPAVIGSGERNYLEWSGASMLEIDCANRQVIIIS